MARLNKYGCDTNHRSCIDRNPSRASRIRQGARGPARWTRSRGSELRTWPVCKNTSEAATVCTQTTIILPFADCPLRPPDRASRVAPQEKKLRTVHRACFFPTQLKTHTRDPHKAFPPQQQFQIQLEPKYKFASVLPPLSFFHLPLRACQSLLSKGAKRATNVEYARRVSPCIFSQFGQVQGLLRCGRLSGITGGVFFLTWRQGR